MNYENLYKEALERAKKLKETWDSQAVVGWCEYLFPELVESEDEKIRKWIIHDIQQALDDSIYNGESVDEAKSAIAWLEKQGEQKIDPDTLIQQRVDALADIIAEQKPIDKVEPRFKVGDKIQYSKGCGTIMTIEKIENGEYIFSNNMGHTTIENGNKWYLVNHVEQNTAWSEEDESIVLGIEQLCNCASLLNIAPDKIDKIKTWLKSLKPQNNITDEELAQAKKDAYNDALDKIEHHSGEPTFDDGWSAAIDYIRKKKPAYKVKPKFHEGDWVVVSTTKGDRIVQIASVEYFKDGHPSYVTTEGRWFGNGTKARLLTDKDVETIPITENKFVVKNKGLSEGD